MRLPELVTMYGDQVRSVEMDVHGNITRFELEPRPEPRKLKPTDPGPDADIDFLLGKYVWHDVESGARHHLLHDLVRLFREWPGGR